MNKRNLKRAILISSFLLFGIGTLLHFAYDFLGNNFLIGLISPVNESVFEHLKLAVFPILGWWIVFYLVKKDKYSLNKNKWFIGCFASMILSILTILLIYYFVAYGIGKESLVIDILSLYIGILVGQFAGYYTYKYTSKEGFIIPIILIVVLIISFILFTILTPKLPVFRDDQTNTYGITKSTK